MRGGVLVLAWKAWTPLSEETDRVTANMVEDAIESFMVANDFYDR